MADYREMLGRLQHVDEALLPRLLLPEPAPSASPPAAPGRSPTRDPDTDVLSTIATDPPGVPEQHQPDQPRPCRTVDRTISATCQLHGASGFCNLRVTRNADGSIVLDPHVAGACVLTLDELASAQLRDLLIEWREREGTR